MAKTSKFFRVATEGGTTDGRVIQREWIEQAAKNYNPTRYGARVNMEHYRSILADSPFRMYGDVLALEARDVEDGKKALFAQIDPTDDLVAMNRARQKVYTSAEFEFDFSGSGQAYLVGLAVTDSPASLGTEMLKFAAGAGQSNPFLARKQRPENVISEAIEFTLELEDADTPSLLEGFSSKIRQLLSGKQKSTDANFAELSQAVEVVAESQQGVLEQFAALKETAGQVEQLTTDLAKLKTSHDELVTTLSQQNVTTPRTPATGGTQSAVSDC